MAPIPSACSGCRRPFAAQDARRRLVMLEGTLALCSECDWRASHPETIHERIRRIESTRAA